MEGLDVRIKLAKLGNGEKTHAGYAVLNDNGTVHHIATHCNTYPGTTKARLIGEITSVEQVSCPKCRKTLEWVLAGRP